MQKKILSDVQCPVVRSLERVGEWWSILILREAFYGTKRFDEFQKNLDIATNMLSRRLSVLVAEGLLERRQYCEKPPRYEYVLTSVGLDFRPIILTLVDWGNKHFEAEGASAQLTDLATGKPVDLILVDRNTGKPITLEDHAVLPGPAASERLRQRLTRAVKPSGVDANPAAPATPITPSTATI
jgi:DNA-binding HxlR family transcriptional regulator